MNSNLLYFSLLTGLLLTSCSSSNSIRLKDSSDSKLESSANVEIAKKVETATIVHIDKKERIVTIRCNCPIEHGGYYTTHLKLNDNENSLIKIYDTSYESIFIADILEGSPKITDSIFKVSEERSQELDQKYTDATID
jgi:hypothetical protein